MQRLAAAQGEADLSPATAPAHLVTVLTQLLTDQLEHSDVGQVAPHGAWLAAAPANTMANTFGVRMNGLLYGSGAAGIGPLLPGTVYRVKDTAQFKTIFGDELATFVALCGPGGKDTDPGRKHGLMRRAQYSWRSHPHAMWRKITVSMHP